MFSRLPISRADNPEPVVERLASARLGQFSSALARSWDDGVFENSLKEHTEAAFALCFDTEVAGAFRQRCPVPGTNEQDYLSRLMGADEERLALMSTRFLNMRSQDAFVQLEATSFALDLRGLGDLRTAAKVHYRRFSPKWLRVFVGYEEATNPMLDELEWMPDLVVVAGSRRDMESSPRPEHFEKLELRAWTGAYPRYADTYRQFCSANPHLQDHVGAFSNDELCDIEERGQLFDAYVAGTETWAGLIGAVPETVFGAPAFTIYEELLAEEFRGQGLGPVLQRHLLESLDGEEPVVWGTIHEHNKASLRTALSCGRKRVGHYRLYALD